MSAVALVVDVGTSYRAWGDQALIELQTRDVGQHPVLVGLYSRDGWNHPGPALFYLLALPYQLSGSNSIGLHLGALVINGAAITGMAVIARRRGGTPLLLVTLLASAVLVRTLGPDFLHDPWVPSVTVLPFGLLVLLAWEATAGKAWALPVGAGVASFCVQTHAGFALPAVPLLLGSAAWLVVGAWRSRRPAPRDLRRAGIVAIVVLAVMWLPPLVDQVTGSPGNLTEVAEYFNDPDPEQRRHGFGDGLRVVADQFTLSPEWLTGADRANPFTGEPGAIRSTPVPVLLVPFALAIAVAVRRRWPDAALLAGTVTVALGLGVLSITRVIGNLFVYRLRWTWVLAALAMVVVAWVVVRLVTGWRRRAWDRWAAPAVVVVLVSLTVASTVAAARAGSPYPHESAALPPVVDAVEEALPDRDGHVIVRSDTFSGNLYAVTLVLLLERRGLPVRVEEEDEKALGRHRVHDEGPVRATLVVYEGLDILSVRAGDRLVAISGGVSDAERARLARRKASLDAAHAEGTVSDERYLVELDELSARLASAVAVYRESPD